MIYSTENDIGGKKQKLITGYFKPDKEGKPWYRLILRSKKKFFNNSAICVTYSIQFVNFNENATLESVMKTLHDIFTDIIHRVMKNYDPDRTRAVTIIEDTAGRLVSPIICPLQTLNNYSADLILSAISAVAQSKKELKIDNQIEILFGTISMPSIGVAKYNKMRYVTRDKLDSLKRKRFIHIIDDNNDQNCMIRAITYTFHLSVNKNFWCKSKIKHANFERYAIAIAKKCKIEWGQPVNLDQIKDIEEILERRIVLVKLKPFRGLFEMFYAGSNKFDIKLYILLIPPYDSLNYHAQPIKSGEKLFWADRNKQHHCQKCNDIVGETHKCSGNLVKKTCIYCKRNNCPGKVTNPDMLPTISCRYCCQSFLNWDCYISHKNLIGRRKKPLCVTRYKCFLCFSGCNKLPRDKHRCNYRYCSNCSGDFLDMPLNKHFCHMKIGRLDASVQDKLIAYDIETCMNSYAQCESPYFDKGQCTNCLNSICTQKIHIPLVIASFSCCKKCKSVWNRPPTTGPGSICDECGIRCPKCQNSKNICHPPKKDSHGNECGSRRVIFYGEQCIALWLDYLLDERRYGSKVFAHNSASFDNS